MVTSLSALFVIKGQKNPAGLTLNGTVRKLYQQNCKTDLRKLNALWKIIQRPLAQHRTFYLVYSNDAFKSKRLKIYFVFCASALITCPGLSIEESKILFHDN